MLWPLMVVGGLPVGGWVVGGSVDSTSSFFAAKRDRVGTNFPKHQTLDA